MAKADVDWLQVRAGYEAGIPVRKLAAEFGIGSPGTISKRAASGGWAKPQRPGDDLDAGEAPDGPQRQKQKQSREKQRHPVSESVSAADGQAPETSDTEDGGSAEDDELDEREQRFVLHYACCGVGPVAARRAGYAVASSRNRAMELLRRPRVLAAIEATRKERAARLEVSADRIVTELARVGLVNITDLAKWGPNGVALNLSEDLSPDDSAAIVEVSQTKDGEVKIKLAPKMSALKLLAEHTGVVGRRPDDKELKDSDVAELPDAERAARLAALLDRARARRDGQAVDGGDADLGASAGTPDDGL